MALVREPVGEWVRLSARTRRAVDGIGLTTGRLSDRMGYVGEVAQPLLIAAR